MADDGDGFVDYVRRARETTLGYVRELLTENEKLVSFAMILAEEKKVLASEVALLRRELGHHASARALLDDRIAEVEAQGRALTERYAGVEQMNADLANLYVASRRLHGSLARDEAVSTIEDIVVNLIGSEEFAIFEQTAAGAPPSLVAARGVDHAYAAVLGGASPLMREALARGEVRLASSGDDGAPIACVPLKAGDRVTGVIAIYRLLGHKPAFEPLDHEIFELLSTNGGAALSSGDARADLPCPVRR